MHHDKRNEIMERIEVLMKQRGIKATQLSFAIGVSTGNISE